MSAGHGPAATPARTGRTQRLLVALLGFAFLAAGLLVVPATPASADEPASLAQITLTSVEPTLPKPGGTVTLAGTVRNTSKDKIVRPQAVFWRNQAPITDTDGLEAALGSDSNDPIGARHTPVFQNLYDAGSPYLAPGKTVKFRLTAKISDLALAPSDGVYLMGVHLLQDGVPVAVARTRVFVPVLSTQPEHRSLVASLVVLASRPAQIAPGLLSDDHLSAEVGPTGRLTRLLAAALSDDETSFAVDPALVEELQTMRAGYKVQTAEGGTASGTGQVYASRWLADFGRLLAGHDGYRLLYGSPDVAALVHARQTSVLTSAVAAGKAVALTAALPLLVLPTGGTADAATVQAAESLEPRAVLLADSSTGGAGPLLVGSAGVPLLTYATTALGGGPGPDPSDDAVHVQQRVLATSWIDATTNAQPRAQVRLVKTTAQAGSLHDRADPPWVEPAPLSAVLARHPASWNQQLHYPSAAADAELGGGQLSTLDRFVDSEQTWQDLLVDGTAAKKVGDAAVARAASGAWRGHSTARSAFLRPQQAVLDERLTDKVRISSARKVSTAGQRGIYIPITIRNDLDLAAPAGSATDPDTVRVMLGFASDNRSRLQIKSIGPESIRPQDNFTDNAQVTAKANGTVPVLAQLYTESGRKVGRPVEIQVRVTQNGTTGWAIAIAAGLVLFGSTGFRIRQVAREKARAVAEAPADDEPVSGLTSAPPADGAAPGSETDSFKTDGSETAGSDDAGTETVGSPPFGVGG